MGFLSKIFGVEEIAKPVEAVGNIIDKLFTSDEERLDRQILLERLNQQPILAQTEINKIEASHPSIFVSGWRPYIGWICGTGIGVASIINPLIVSISTRELPKLDVTLLVELLLALLGLGTLRTYEKLKDIQKRH